MLKIHEKIKNIIMIYFSRLYSLMTSQKYFINENKIRIGIFLLPCDLLLCYPCKNLIRENTFAFS